MDAVTSIPLFQHFILEETKTQPEHSGSPKWCHLFYKCIMTEQNMVTLKKRADPEYAIQLLLLWPTVDQIQG